MATSKRRNSSAEVHEDRLGRLIRKSVSIERPRLEFDEVRSTSPELARRVVLLRSRVKDLHEKFKADAERAQTLFRRLTIGLFVGVLFVVLAALAIVKWQGVDPAGNPLLASGVGFMVALGIAGVGAFGVHRRYHAMFQAQWAMNAMSTDIDQVVHEIAIGLPESGDLTDEDRTRLQRELERWRQQFIAALTSFGDQYGSALTAIELPKGK